MRRTCKPTFVEYSIWAAALALDEILVRQEHPQAVEIIHSTCETRFFPGLRLAPSFVYATSQVLLTLPHAVKVRDRELRNSSEARNHKVRRREK